MARFLFVVPPLTGHTNPTVSVGRRLQDRGHRVAWAAHPDPARSLLPEGAELLPVFDALPADMVESVSSQALGLRGASALKFLYDDFLLPLARSMVEGVETALDTFRPDVLVVDQQALAGAAVAQRRGALYVTSATTTAEFTQPFSGLPKVEEWVDERLRSLQRELGVFEADPDAADLRFSPHMVLIFSTVDLIGTGFPYGPHYRFVGPAIGERPSDVSFPWDSLEDRPRVLVSLGTINDQAGARFYRAAVEAFESRSLQAIVVGPPDLVGPVPDNVLVRPRVPQLELLPHMNAVVCHGGHNTVCESLAHGLPLVVAPIRDDQPIIAEQVAKSGAGLRVRFGRVNAEALGRAVDRVLEEPTFRAEAERIQASFREAGGADTAAAELAALAGESSG